jgi:hypothetical protein
VKDDVKKNVKYDVNEPRASWKGALSDAEEAIKRSAQELADWKAVAAICRKRIAENAEWPGTAQRSVTTLQSMENQPATRN